MTRSSGPTSLAKEPLLPHLQPLILPAKPFQSGCIVTHRLPLLSLIAMVIVLLSGFSPTSAADSSMAGRRICIDAGHGGAEPGATTSVDGKQLLEKDVNLEVAVLLRDLLRTAGAETVMTRDPDQPSADATLSIANRYTYCNSAGADVAVSVHTNSVGDSTVDYSMAIYFHNDDRALAEPILARFVSDLGTSRGVLRKDALGFVLKTQMPAVTLEPVFMSNHDEARQLLESCPSDGLCRKAQIARAVAAGLEDYFSALPPDGPNKPPRGPRR